MAGIGPVQISNMALSHIGARNSIESMAENSNEAKQCNLWYDYSRKQALENFDWSFARKRLRLAKIALDLPLGEPTTYNGNDVYGVPDDAYNGFSEGAFAGSAQAPGWDVGQWTYRYQYPPDCIAMRKIWNPLGDQADAVPYEIETIPAWVNAKNPAGNPNEGARSILTDMEWAVGVYTYDCNNPELFTFMFTELVSRGLAGHIAFTLTGKTDVVQAQNQAYAGILRAAPALDANERVGKPPRDAEWIRGRTFYYPYPDPFSRGRG